SELSNFRWAFHHRNHWDYLVHCVKPKNVEEQFLSFEVQLDSLSSNPESLNEWIELISLGNSSFILPELPNCRGSKVRRCFDELMPAVERAIEMPGSRINDIPGSDACIIMNYTYGIVKIYGEPQSDEHPETNSNFETMVKYNFIGTSTTSNESELSNFRWAFHHRNHWDYSNHCL
ncbi:MAG: hypothetical protein OSB66_07635, partial [SAR202 cluster bacterium]|nr:hypothetical protein [SAR202 cluster bacterium]